MQDDGSTAGFFLRLGADSRAHWTQFRTLGCGALSWILGCDQPGGTLSLALAHSSGVVGSDKSPFLLSYSFHLRYDRHPLAGLRDTYVLSDGGKSDNTGVLPLLERGVKLIVMSQMGKEKAYDPNPRARQNNDIEDMELARKQAERLFGCTFDYDLGRNGQLRDSPVAQTAYRGCRNGRSGSIIVVRPYIGNVQGFLAALRQENPELARDLEIADQHRKRKLVADTGQGVCPDCFPETPTFELSYPVPLIRAYYLLGRHIARNELRTELERQLAAPGR